MAQYRFEVKVITRGKGHATSIAKAAYNSRQKLTDERTGQEWDYRKKGGLEFEAIFAPKDAPKWVFDRQTLWNEVEDREDNSPKRDTAQVARAIIANFPHQLDAQRREWMLKDFAREMTRKGMIVDMAIHAPDPHGDDRNYHAHIQLTMRAITPEGFGNKVRSWNTKEEINSWRDRWAEMGERQLKRMGLDKEAHEFKEGRKSLKDRRREAIEKGDVNLAKSLERKPTRHEGPKARAMKRNSWGKSEIMKFNAKVTVVNALDKAKNILDAAPTFPLHAAARLAERIVDGAIDMLAPILTPAQQHMADVAREQREHQADIERHRTGHERER